MPLKVLFVCTANELRSRTAHQIFKDDPRMVVDSAGTGQGMKWSQPRVKLTLQHVEAADVIFCMEDVHADYVKSMLKTFTLERRVITLNISDLYDYMDGGLIQMLKLKVERHLEGLL